MAQYDLIFIRNGSSTGTEFVEVNLAKPGGAGRYLTQNPTTGVLSWSPVAYSELSGVPATFTPSAHNHAIADVTNLQTTLNGKEPTITVLPVSKGGTGASSLTGVLKGNGTGAFTAAVAGTDYVIPSGNVATATKLATARTINGVSFDGSANITVADSTKIPLTQKGAANGVAELDAAGKVPANQLPSYVDDVLEAASFAALPGTGETGKIYTTTDNNKIYRWSGTAYIEISPTAGNADTATKLATPRTIAASGDGSWSVSFDGSANVSAALTLANVATAGTYPKVTVNSKGLVTAGAVLAATDIPTLAISKITNLQTTLDTKLQWAGSVPASVSASGGAGQIAYSDSYIYICVGANTWKRAALASWAEQSE